MALLISRLFIRTFLFITDILLFHSLLCQSSSTPTSSFTLSEMAPKTSKRKTPSQHSPHEEAQQEERTNASKESTKKAKRESIEEQRAKAREWAEQRAERKRALAEAAVASPVSGSIAIGTASVQTNISAKKEVTKILDVSPIAVRTEKNAVFPFTNQNSGASQALLSPPTAVPPSIQPFTAIQSATSTSKSSTPAKPKTKREEIFEEKERARLWAELRRIGSPSGGSGVPQPCSTGMLIKTSMQSITEPLDIISQNDVARVVKKLVEETKAPVIERVTCSTATAVENDVVDTHRMVKEVDSVVLTSKDHIKLDENRHGSILFSQRTATVERVVPDAEKGGILTGNLLFITSVTKSLNALFRSFTVAFSICIRIAALSLTLGFIVYAWAFIYRDIATKVMYERSLSTLSNSSLMGRHTSHMTGFCYFNDMQTESLLPSHEISPSAAHGAECLTTEMISKKRVTCPEHGVCKGGVWQSCAPSDMWEVDEQNRLCRLTDKALKELDKAQKLLSVWTSNCLCGDSPRVLGRSTKKEVCIHHWKETDDGLAYFDINDVAWQLVMMEKGVDSLHATAEEIEEKKKTIVTLFSLPAKAPMFVYHLSEKSPSYLVAYSKEASSLVSLPYTCWLRMWLFYFLGLGVYVVHWIVVQLFSSAVQYPVPVSISFATICILYKVHDTYKKRFYTRLLVSQARAISYDKLIYESQHGSNSYSLLHLGEDVAQTLFPDSLKRRQDFLKRVWPRVVIELKNDVRIQQCQKAVGGMVLECWTWLGNKGSSLSTPATKKSI